MSGILSVAFEIAGKKITTVVLNRTNACTRASSNKSVQADAVRWQPILSLLLLPRIRPSIHSTFVKSVNLGKIENAHGINR